MRLDVGDSGGANDPRESHILDALSRLDERDDFPFLVLSRDLPAPGFIRAIGGPYAFLVEYRESGSPRQFRSALHLPKEIVANLLGSYYRGEEAYKTQVEWREITQELQRQARRTKVIQGLAVTAAVLAAYAALQVCRFIWNW